MAGAGRRSKRADEERTRSLGLDPQRIPRHIACVMDGNGRWAQQRGLKRTDGHAAGEEALFDAVEGALELGVSWFSVYAFSTENWSRPPDEVRFLMQFNRKILLGHRDDLNDKGVRIRFLGRRDWRVPRSLLRLVEETEELTRHNRRMTFSVCFNYGGRAEILDAVTAMMRSGVTADQVNEKNLRKHFYAPDMPDPDLVIRTSGEYRISNFLLWELAYSELIFSDIFWPDFRRENLYDAVRQYQARDRRFGGLA
ncbi:MAG: polyprenyl diphosphate synthase [Acidimicrobiales bacterium]